MQVQVFDGRDPNNLLITCSDKHVISNIFGPTTICLVLCNSHYDLIFPRKKQSTGIIEDILHLTSQVNTEYVPFVYVPP
jgi:hypothetical protein